MYIVNLIQDPTVNAPYERDIPPPPSSPFLTCIPVRRSPLIPVFAQLPDNPIIKKANGGGGGFLSTQNWHK